VHEFLSPSAEDIAATTGFIAGLHAPIMGSGGTSVWISSSSTLFPPALKSFGVQPDRIIFLHLKSEKDILWAMEESLKCSVLSAVVGEISEISFTASRRLQLAVEQSRVTGFIIRRKTRKMNTTACVSRWRVTPVPSAPMDDLPGIGFPTWRVELIRMRNGSPGVWEIKWMNGIFHPVYQKTNAATAKPDYIPFTPVQSLVSEIPPAQDALSLKAG
jgi:protein ImuA